MKSRESKNPIARVPIDRVSMLLLNAAVEATGKDCSPRVSVLKVPS
jgi:hypothetical protein